MPPHFLQPFRFCFRLIALGALLLAPFLHASPEANDVLVYKDGDRVQGRLVSTDGGTIVFRSNRFGELRVPSAQAEVIRNGAPAPTLATAPTDTRVPPSSPNSAAQPAATPAPKADSPEAELAEQRAIVERMASRLRQVFGPWHGRIAFSSQLAASTSSSSQSDVVEGKMERKWTGDELRFEGRYEFSATDDETSTDLTKANAYWRHDISKHWFTILHPSLEWNGNYVVDDEDADYFLIQTELGVGRTVWDHQGKKLRLGVAENIYNVWELTDESYAMHNVESAFLEAELKLPWNMKLTERGIRYFSLSGGSGGWENQFELSKKFTENLVVALKHDIRRNEPDWRLEDYSSWRILLGLDF